MEEFSLDKVGLEKCKETHQQKGKRNLNKLVITLAYPKN